MKKCTKCKIEKSEDNFYIFWRAQRKKHYLSIYCKECFSEMDKEYRRKKFDELNERRRTRKNQQKKRIGRDPVKYRCRYILKNAVDHGKFEKNEFCEHCKRKPEMSSEIEAHHLDYSQPFLVVWLCRNCHQQEHRRLRNGGVEFSTNH